MSQAMNKCDLLLEYMLGELDDTEREKFEQEIQRSAACRSELDSLWLVHQRLVSILTPNLEELAISQKSSVLTHAFSARLPLTDHPMNGETGEIRFLGSGRGFRFFPRRTRSSFLRASVVTVILLGTLALGALTAEKAGSKTSSLSGKPHVTIVSLQPSPSYPKSVGQIRMVKGRQASLVVDVTHVPIQPSTGCYAVWGLSGSNASSLGEFVVNQRGVGSTTIPLLPDVQFNRIEITLEPRWGDSSPLGPTILSSSATKKIG